MDVVCYNEDRCTYKEKGNCMYAKLTALSTGWTNSFKGITHGWAYCPHVYNGERRYVRTFEPFYIHIVREHLKRRKNGKEENR